MASDMSESPSGSHVRREPSDNGQRRLNWSPWNWLLVVPLLATLIPTIYNRVNPKFFGIPFFYWYQMGCIAIGVLCTLIVYRATRGER